MSKKIIIQVGNAEPIAITLSDESSGADTGGGATISETLSLKEIIGIGTNLFGYDRALAFLGGMLSIDNDNGGGPSLRFFDPQDPAPGEIRKSFEICFVKGRFGAIAGNCQLALLNNGTDENGWRFNGHTDGSITGGGQQVRDVIFIPPTSDPHVAGASWNNGGTPAISAGN